MSETVKNHFRFVRGYSDPSVDDVESKPARRSSRFRLHPKRDRASLGEFQGVSNQIDKNLPQTIRIPNQPQRDARQNLKSEVQTTILRPRSHHLDYFFEKNAEIEADRFQFQVPGFHLRRDGVEHDGGFPRTRDAGEDRDLPLWDAQRDVLQVVLARAADVDELVHDRRLGPNLLYALTSICSVEYIKRVESVFEIIAEPNRRAILSLLVSSQQSVGEIERQLRMPQTTVSKHLRVLREAGFVESTVDAQRRLYRLKPEPFQEVDAWLAPFRRFWSAHVDALERHLDRMDQSTPTKRKTRRKRHGPNRERHKGETK